MKILAISWASHTSVNRQIFRVLDRQEGINVTVVIPKEINIEGSIVACDNCEEDIDIISLDITHGNPRYNRYVGAYSLLKKIQPDIIYHEDDPISLQAVQYGIWCFLNNKKLICRTNQNTPIGFKDEIGRLGILKGIFYASLKLIFCAATRRFVDHVFAISNDGVNVCRTLGYQNVTKIPLGFDEEIFHICDQTRQRIRKDLGIDGVVFSYIGRVIEGKGLHVLLEALSMMKRHKWTLLLDDFLRPNQTEYQHRIVEQIDYLGLKDRVIFFKADHKEISNYMNASDVVIVPSITTANFKEQYGRVAPESMACGCLVIASDSGTLPELVGQAGWVFEEGNVTELESLLVKTLTLKGSKKIRSLAAIHAQNYLGVEAQKKLIISVIKGLRPSSLLVT